jgi:hypothetical protein
MTADRKTDDLVVVGGLKALQTRLESGVFRSAAQERLDCVLEKATALTEQILSQIDVSGIREVDAHDYYKIMMGLQGLKRIAIESDKARLEAENHHDKIMMEFKEQVRQDLYEYPELQEKLRQIAEKAAKTVADRPRVGRPKKHSKKEPN